MFVSLQDEDGYCPVLQAMACLVLD